MKDPHSGVSKRSAARALGGRAAWTIADQAVSSINNAAIGIIIARSVSAEGFGAFALVFSVFTFVQAVSQGVSGQVVIIRYSARTRTDRLRAGAHAAATALGVGLVASCGVLSAGLIVGGTLLWPLAAGAAVLPLLALQDMWRTVMICDERARSAFVNDLVQAAAQLLLLTLLVTHEVRAVELYVLVWGAGATLAACVGVLQLGILPTFVGLKRWIGSNKDISMSATGNAITTLGAAQVTFILLATTAPLQDLGALRGAQTVLGPLNIVGFAIGAFAVPEIVRRDFDRRGYVTVALAISLLLVVVDLVWGGVLLLVPDHVGDLLLGETWTGATAALPGMIVFVTLIAASTGASCVMRALGRVDLSFVSSILLGPMIIVFPVVGVLAFGVVGAAGGFALAAALALGPTWLLLRRALRAVDAEGAL